MLNNRLSYVLGGVAVVGLALGAGFYFGKHGGSAAYADVPASAQAVASASGAPSVPGLCVLSQKAVYANAKIGVAASARYRQLTADLNAQLAPQQQAIQDEAKKLEAQKASMPAAQFQQQQGALANRLRALQAQAGVDSRDLEFTRGKAAQQIAQLANPVISEAYKTHNCGALFSRDMMLVGNPGMDLTPIVVAGLDAKRTAISFDLSHAPAAAAAAH
jgi:Skp family chaperone for outer membrane proteins